MKWRKSGVFVLAAAVAAMSAAFAQALDMEMVYVDNAGNTGEQVRTKTLGWGAVDHAFYMGKYEVTAGQFAEYLSATAWSDDLDLYGGVWGDGAATYPHIKQNGAYGSYSYSVTEGYENLPMNWINWGDAARFCNWLHNGMPTTGVQDATTTEDGAYTLNGNVSSYDAVTRNAGAQYFLPTADEWYKAAYHKNTGTGADYWEYPTRSDTAPIAALANPDLGNEATMKKPDGTYLDPTYFRTEVGAHENSYSAYGCFDMAANEGEWSERVSPTAWNKRQVMGGNYRVVENYTDASLTSEYYVNVVLSEGGMLSEGVGFRVASLVPEPGTVTLLLMGCFGLALFAWKRR